MQNIDLHQVISEKYKKTEEYLLEALTRRGLTLDDIAGKCFRVNPIGHPE